MLSIEITEFFVFLKRYYERVAPDAYVHVTIEMNDVKDRTVVATEESVPFFDDYISRESKIVIDRDHTVPELRASAEELAIGVIQNIFEIFNWNNPDLNMIRGWQHRLLSRTL